MGIIHEGDGGEMDTIHNDFDEIPDVIDTDDEDGISNRRLAKLIVARLFPFDADWSKQAREDAVVEILDAERTY